jgi:hypothetical protein
MLSKITKINKESLTTKLTLLIVGLTAGSALLVPATYASFHPVTSGEIADGTIQSVDIGNGQVRTEDIGTGQVRTGDILDGTVRYADVSHSFIAVEHRDDCDCGGIGWDPNGETLLETIVDDRITPNSVVSITMDSEELLICATNRVTEGIVDVWCDNFIPDNAEINYAIFNPQ